MTTSSAPASPLSTAPTKATPAAGTVLTGVPVVPGIAYAPVIRPGRHPVLEFVAKAIEVAEADRDAELARFSAAAAAVADRLRERAAHATGSASEVLAATAQLAQDRAWLGESEKWIRMGTPAVRATAEAVEKFADMFTKMGGLMAERVTDLRDIRDRVIAQLSGLPEPGVPVPDVPSILLAEDLAPADTAGLDPALIVGLATSLGGPDQPHRDHRAAVGDSVRGGDRRARRRRGRHDGAHRRRTRDGCRVPGRRRGRGGGAGRKGGRRGGRRAGRDPAPRRMVTRSGSWRTCRTAPPPGRPRRHAAEGVGLFRTELCFLNTRDRTDRRRAGPDLRRGARGVPGPQGGDPHAGCRVGQAAEVRRTCRGGQPGARRPRHPHRHGQSRHCWSTSWTRSPAAAERTGSAPWVMAPMIATAGEAKDFAAQGPRARPHARRDDRGARGRAAGRPHPRARRLPVDRHQRPRAVHDGGRPDVGRSGRP